MVRVVGCSEMDSFGGSLRGRLHGNTNCLDVSYLLAKETTGLDSSHPTSQ